MIRTVNTITYTAAIALVAVVLAIGLCVEPSPVPPPAAEKPTWAELSEFIEGQRADLKRMGERVKGDKRMLETLHSHVADYTDELPPKP